MRLFVVFEPLHTGKVQHQADHNSNMAKEPFPPNATSPVTRGIATDAPHRRRLTVEKAWYNCYRHVTKE